MTNLEKIKSLTLEEMVKFLNSLDSHGTFTDWYCGKKCPYRQDGKCSCDDECMDCYTESDEITKFLESEFDSESKPIIEGTH